MLVPLSLDLSDRADGLRDGGQWVAHIAGPCPRYGLAREFVRPYRDFRHARQSMRGRRTGIRGVWMLAEGEFYEVCERRTGRGAKGHRRRYVTVRFGEVLDVTKESVIDAVSEPRGHEKVHLGIDVLAAAKQRIAWAFDRFERVYMSGPSGKDSSAMMHLVCQEARRRGRRVGVLYVDLEAQYQLTIDHVREMFSIYADVIDPHWVALPIRMRNAVSMEEPYWVAWDPWAKKLWVREPPPEAVTDRKRYPFHWQAHKPKLGEPREAMEFEEFIESFGHWYAGDRSCACLVGIRTDESLNRWRSIAKKRKSRLQNKPWTAWKGGGLFNVYPIYDWKTEDIWTFFGREGLPYNKLYDHLYRAGLPLHNQRICQPYGDDQRRGLNMFHVIEPETWSRVVARVAGANSGALYAGKQGNILGNGKVTLPEGHTWQSFARFLLESLPSFEREHYEDKIAVFLKWYESRGYPDGIPDEADPKMEAARKEPSWRRVCKTILKNDRMCRGLGFSQHVSGTYENYRKLMKKRRQQWGMTSVA